jgi:hypothetical protein
MRTADNLTELSERLQRLEDLEAIRRRSAILSPVGRSARYTSSTRPALSCPATPPRANACGPPSAGAQMVRSRRSSSVGTWTSSCVRKVSGALPCAAAFLDIGALGNCLTPHVELSAVQVRDGSSFERIVRNRLQFDQPGPVGRGETQRVDHR